MRNLSHAIATLALLVLTGCIAPSTSIKTPMTARPAEREVLGPHNGAIFQVGRNERPLFEDAHARNVGDILTINVIEATTANQSTSNSASHAGNTNISTPTITKGVASVGASAGGATTSTLLTPFNVTNASSGSLNNKSADSGVNNFSGTITVTVIEVLPNGNLLVGGEKLMAINQNNEHIRISGVVNPINITNNTVQSSQVADVHLEYKGSDNNLDASQMMGMLGRVFLSILPF